MRLLKHFLIFLALFVQTVSAQSVANPKVTYFHNDITGTAVAATDENGEVIWREQRRAYGEIKVDPLKPRSLDEFSVGYTGHQADKESGLTYAKARYYNKSIGRFYAPDPIPFRESDLVSINRYAYAGNNPYMFFDPWGKDVLGLDPYSPGMWIRDGKGNIADPYNDYLQREGTQTSELLAERAVKASGYEAGKALTSMIPGGAFFICSVIEECTTEGWIIAGVTSVAPFVGVRGTAPVARSAAKVNFIKAKFVDPAADAVARRLGGAESSVIFPNRFKNREFDIFSDKFIGQTKPANFQLGSAFRNQAKATFEAALELGRKPYFHFDGPPDPSVITKLKEYGQRYGITPVIDTKPL